MKFSLRSALAVAVVLVVIGVLENALWGKDHPGTAHDISVAFFLVAVIGLAAIVVIGLTALVRTVGARR